MNEATCGIPAVIACSCAAAAGSAQATRVIGPRAIVRSAPFWVYVPPNWLHPVEPFSVVPSASKARLAEPTAAALEPSVIALARFQDVPASDADADAGAVVAGVVVVASSPVSSLPQALAASASTAQHTANDVHLGSATGRVMASRYEVRPAGCFTR